MSRKKKAAPVPKGKNSPNTRGEDINKFLKSIENQIYLHGFPMQYDEAWINRGKICLVKWGGLAYKKDALCFKQLPQKDAYKYIAAVLHAYQIGRVDCITCDLKEYYQERVAEREYVCYN